MGVGDAERRLRGGARRAAQRVAAVRRGAAGRPREERALARVASMHALRSLRAASGRAGAAGVSGRRWEGGGRRGGGEAAGNGAKL